MQQQKERKNRRDVRQILNNIDEHVCILHEILKKKNSDQRTTYRKRSTTDSSRKSAGS